MASLNLMMMMKNYQLFVPKQDNNQHGNKNNPGKLIFKKSLLPEIFQTSRNLIF